jgi:hypothetical protein
LVTWVYDEIGCAGAILDEFCIRDLSGNTVGWVFGLSVFSHKGEHIGWFEEGIFFDLENKVVGFVPGASLPGMVMPAPGHELPFPAFSKRPCVPTLRGRSARPLGQGWSTQCLASYLASSEVPSVRARFIPSSASLGRVIVTPH